MHIMTVSAEELGRDSLLVVAHPDDEALWFSSVLAHVPRVAIAYLDEHDQPPEVTEARVRVQRRYPLGTAVWLGVRGAGMFGKGIWDGSLSPWGTPFAESDDIRAYQDGYREVERNLAELAAKDKVRRIICHSPWGEYGHEDHVQVFVAAASVAARLGLEVWYPLYCSQFTVALANERVHDFSSSCVMLPANTALAHRLRDLYMEEGCWTWSPRYEWLPSETFVRLSSGQAQAWGAVPINYLRLPFRELSSRPGVAAIGQGPTAGATARRG